jgi:hypothetical protein
MKTYFLTFTLLLVIINAEGQQNQYFQNNPQWQVSSSCAVPLPCVQQETRNYNVNGDTIINALTYKQIYKKGEGTYNWMGSPPAGCSGSYWYIDTVPSWFLRSDGKQMYLRQPNDASEYLLYDFDLAIGDTLPVTFNNYQSDVYVTGADSIYTPYGYRKRFELAGNTVAQYLIEGVGSSNGLIEPVSLVFECGNSLLCFSLNDTSYYPVAGPSCNLTVGISSPENNSIISIAPNPFSTHTMINTGNTFNNATITVFNSTGQVVKEFKNFSGLQYTFYREKLPEGLYFVRITQFGKAVSTSPVVIVNE